MIKPINVSPAVSRGHEKDGYKDPLLTWPLRGAAFTNEVGEAMRPLIGSAATLSWAPALLYIGADVYDKYKNDQTEYKPNSKRGFKQALFQGLASVGLPVVSVKLGQNLFSLFGLCTKDKIRFNTQEHVNKLAQEFVANGKMHAYAGKDEECVKEFLNIVASNIDLSDERDLKNAYSTNKNNIHDFAETTVKELIDLRKNLLNPSEEFKTSKVYAGYKQSLKMGQTENVAVKSSLQKVLKKKVLKGNFVKTIGGFMALGVSIKPIDKFVEEILIGKIVGPQLDKQKKDACELPPKN